MNYSPTVALKQHTMFSLAQLYVASNKVVIFKDLVYKVPDVLIPHSLKTPPAFRHVHVRYERSWLVYDAAEWISLDCSSTSFRDVQLQVM